MIYNQIFFLKYHYWGKYWTCVFNYISNGFVDKMVDDLRSNFFPQISLLRKVLKFPCVFNHISNGLVEKMMDDLGSIFFPQISLLGKLLEFPYEN